MFNINDIKNGMTFVYENNLYLVVEFQHVKPGKGAAFVRVKMKNLRTSSTIEKTFNTNIKLEKAIITKKTMQYLYNTGEEFFFMDMETYDQVEISKKQIEHESNFLKENDSVELVYFKDELIGVNLPDKIVLKVVTTEPAVKGNTATNATKDAVLETGLTIRVPLFIAEGDELVVSTADGKYVSRN